MNNDCRLLKADGAEVTVTLLVHSVVELYQTTTLENEKDDQLAS